MIGRRGKMARLIYLTNVGTIPDETNVKVKLGEEIIGTIDESFLERLTPATSSSSAARRTSSSSLAASLRR